MVKSIQYFIVTILVIIPGIIFSQAKKLGIPEIEFFNRRMYEGATQNWSVAQSPTGFLYFANNDGVLEYDGVNWRLYNDLGSSIVRSVKEVGDRIYCGSYNEYGYYEYDSLSVLKYHTLVKESDAFKTDDIWNIYEWNDKIVFHSEKGLSIYEDDRFLTFIPARSRFISAFVVNGMLLVQDERVGLMEVRGTDIYPVSGGGVFASKEVTVILPVSDSKIVIGTMKNGLYMWDMQMFEEWNVPVNGMLKSINVFCGVGYNSEFLVFGTIQGGLVISDLDGNIFMQINKDKGLKNNTVLSVYTDIEGNIWGGLDNGIVKVNFNSSVTFLQGYYNLGTGYVMDHYQSNYYFGTNQALYKINEDKFNSPLKDREDFIRIKGTEGQVWSLYHDMDLLLCGHNLGVMEISGDQSRMITPPEVNGVWNFKSIKGYPNLLVSGTYSGLVIFEKERGKWKYRNKVEGFNESSRYIEWDENGDLWISHGYNGIYKISLNNDYSKVSHVDTFINESFIKGKVPLILSKVDGKCTFSNATGIYHINSRGDELVRAKQYDAYFESGNYPIYIKSDRYGNLWCFFNGEVKVLRRLEDGTYKIITYPFLPLERKLVNGFEYLYVHDDKNVFFGVEDGFAHYSVNEYINYKKPFKVHIRYFKGVGDSIPYQLNSVGDSAIQHIIPTYEYRKNAFSIQFAAPFHERRGVLYSAYLRNDDLIPSNWVESTSVSLSNLYEGEYEFVVQAKNQYGILSKPVSFKFIVLPPWHRSFPAEIGFVILILLLSIAVFVIFNRRVELSRQKEKLKQEEKFKIKEEQLKNNALLSEKEMIRMRNEKLRSDMIYKEKELANSTVHLIQKNDLLSDIKLQLKKLIRISERRELERKVNSLIKKIDRDIDNDNNWEVFELHFGQVHEAFFQGLKEKHPDLTSREQKLCAYIKMGMSSKDIASLMNITTRAVENNRYKLRQKLGIDHGENLLEYIESI